MEKHQQIILAAAAVLAGFLLVLGPPHLPNLYTSNNDENPTSRMNDRRLFGLSTNKNDPKTITKRLKRSTTLQETSHDGDQLCIAKVDDGKIVSGSVVDEAGHLHLSLPKGYQAEATVECITYDRVVSSSDEDSAVTGTKAWTKLVKQGGRFEPHICDDPKYFQPGYYDRSTSTWVDHCTGRTFDASEEAWTSARESRLESPPLSPANCPMVADHLRKENKEPLWISFVGDSVTRQQYSQVLKEHGITVPAKGVWPFKVKLSPSVAAWAKYYFVTKLTIEGVEVWLSFNWNFVQKLGSRGPGLPHTWGQFVANAEGSGYSRVDDPAANPGPPFQDDREPDLVLYGPGYHASYMNSRDYGREVERVLTTWQEVSLAGEAALPPPMHVFLNMMPAPWLIPKAYGGDRWHRTRLNEHRKNLAIMGAARKFGFVRSVVDGFSVELPFNGTPEESVHGDAVHVNNPVVLGMVGNRVFEAICTSDLAGGRGANEEGSTPAYSE